MTFEFLICTYGERIQQVPAMLMPQRPDVAYLVSWQLLDAEACPPLPAALASRPDVRVVTLAGRGLSRNRNHALRHARADYLILADDDCRYSEQSIDNIRQALHRQPQADILQFQLSTPQGTPFRSYPPHAYAYANRPRFAYVASCELVLRRAAALPPFDERFGIGAPLGCGEEEVFVHQAAQRGLRIYYEPLCLAVTPAQTTGSQFATSTSVQAAKGGVLCIIHGPVSAALRCIKFAFTRPHTTIYQRLSYLRHLLFGIRYVLTHHPLP